MPPKHRSKSKYKKATGAPLRFKSAYMFFNIAKQKEIRSSMMQGEKLSTTNIAKMVSHAWKSLSDEQRAVWEEMSKQDRARFELEKKNYTGPWKVPAGKDPRSPKRPMSAFLDFSNSRRAQFRKRYPNATNGQISSMLAKEWKEAASEVKNEYIEREARLREQYKRDLGAWEAANTGDIGDGLGGGYDDVDDDEDDDIQEEDDRKPSAIELKSKQHDDESIKIDESSKADNSSHVPGSQQLVVSNYACLPASREQQEEESSQTNYVTLSRNSHPPSSSEVQVLTPLVSTDIGGFLAVAAALSASSEDSPPIRQAPPPAATTDATSRSAMDMNASVREVVSQLPSEHLKDTDLPKTPSD